MISPAGHDIHCKYPLAYLEQLASTFYQVFRLALYLPVGSVEIDKVVSSLLQQLRDLFSESAHVLLEFPGDTVVVEKMALARSQYFVGELCRLFNGLQIVGVEFDQTVNHRLALALAKNLLLWRKERFEIDSHAAFQCKTPGVRIIHEIVEGPLIGEKPLRRDGSGWGVRLNGLCGALSRKGMSRQHVAGFHHFLSVRADSGQECIIAGFPYITWQDVIALLVKVAFNQLAGRSAGKEALPYYSREFDFAALRHLFDGLLVEADEVDQKEALWGFLKFLPIWQSDESCRYPGSSLKLEGGHQHGEQGQQAVVKRFVNQYRIPVRRLEGMAATGNGEGFSVVLQILRDTCPQVCEDKCRNLLLFMLDQPLGRQEWEVFIRGMAEFAEHAGPERFFRFLPPILKHLRQQRQHHSLGCCLDIWRRLPVASQGAIWPFMVNELLVTGIEERRDLYFAAIELIASFDPASSPGAVERLEALDASREKKIAASIFRAPFFDSYRIFALLLTTSLKDPVISRILPELKNDPQDPVFALAAPFLTGYQPEHAEFIRQYLLTSQQGVIPFRLKDSAGMIIVRGLMSLADDEKSEPWVSGAISALVELWVDEAEPLLRQIQQLKNIGVVFSWPRECRLAAQEASRKRAEVLRTLNKRRLRGA